MSQDSGDMKQNSTSSNFEPLLDDLQNRAVKYFLQATDAATGLVADSTAAGAPCSIAAAGMALGIFPIAAERNLLPRNVAADHALRLVKFLRDSARGANAALTGSHGFFFHFLDMKSGQRSMQCELSTIDSAILIAGALIAASYFDGPSSNEVEIRAISESLYLSVDWRWALNGELTLTHGWLPESGFLPYRWRGYDEAIILYALALGSPTFPVSPESYRAWIRSYVWRKIYGYELLYSGPMFTHQYSHLWIDFRRIQDDYMRKKGIDYFENSRRATFVQQEYAIRNPLDFKGYSGCCWGFTACHGPPPGTFVIDGVERRFLGYSARGAPYGPDDGTIAPWAVVASLPFAPEIVLPAIQRFNEMHVGTSSPYAFKSTFNPTYPGNNGNGWICPMVYGIDQGALAIMIENHRTGLIWKLMKRIPYLRKGLLRAGFQGGWLETSEAIETLKGPAH
jgi:hypothetical protein